MKVHPDRIELSGAARELAAIREAALHAPDIRAEIVRSLRQRIDDGRYAPNVRLVARRVWKDLRAFRGAAVGPRAR